MIVVNAMRFLTVLLLLVPAVADEVSSDWRVALQPIERPWVYVDDGGRGEFLNLRIHVFSPDLTAPGPFSESMKMRVRFQAKGLPDYRSTESAWRDSFKTESRGLTLGFWTRTRLATLEDHWGRLPSRMTVTVTLSDDGAPPLSSSAMPVELTPVSRRDATWTQRVQTLRAGQSRQDVLDLLGPALSETPEPWPDGTWRSVLTYPNPEGPLDLPAEMRMTKIYLDAKGRFRSAALHGGC